MPLLHILCSRNYRFVLKLEQQLEQNRTASLSPSGSRFEILRPDIFLLFASGRILVPLVGFSSV